MVESLIGRDVTIIGNLSSEGEIRIEGEIEGDVECASLVLGETASVKGGVTAAQVIVGGRLNGSITGDTVTLQPSCHVDGEIHHKSLMIEQGAFFEGLSRRSDKAAAADEKSKPSADRSAPAAEAAKPPARDDSDLEQYVADVKKFAADADREAVEGIVTYLGKGVLAQRDASLVSCSDAEELKRVRDNFCKKKLGLSRSDDEIDKILKEVCSAMSVERNKSRVTFYYLIAEKTGNLAPLAG